MTTTFKNFQLHKLESLLIPIDKLSNILFDFDKQDADEIIENRKLGITTPIQLSLPKDRVPLLDLTDNKYTLKIEKRGTKK